MNNNNIRVELALGLEGREVHLHQVIPALLFISVSVYCKKRIHNMIFVNLYYRPKSPLLNPLKKQHTFSPYYNL